MAWQFIVALMVTIPVIMLPLILILYLNIGDIRQARKGSRRQQITDADNTTPSHDD